MSETTHRDEFPCSRFSGHHHENSIQVFDVRTTLLDCFDADEFATKLDKVSSPETFHGSTEDSSFENLASEFDCDQF